MIWRTFEWLHAKHDIALNESLVGIVAKMGWLKRRIDGMPEP